MYSLPKTTLYVSLLLAALGLQAEPRPPENSTHFAKQMADISPRHSQTAIMAIDLANNQLIYSHQPDTLLIPASTQKVLTAVTAMAALGLIHRDARFSGLITSLPQAGVSGTLKYRQGYTKPPLKNLIFAKTGSMQGVANLAGFMRLPQQQDILFVVLENGITPEPNKSNKPAFSAHFLTTLLREIPPAAQVNTASQTDANTMKLSH